MRTLAGFDALTVLAKDIKLVCVRYIDSYGQAAGKEYTFKAPKDLEIKETDYALVPTSGVNPALVLVIAVHDTNVAIEAGIHYKWLICKAGCVSNLEEHAKRVESDQALAETYAKVQKRIQVARQIEELRKGLASDPEGLAMLDKLTGKE